VTTTAAVLLLNNHVHAAAKGQGPCKSHSTMLGLVAGQRALPIGYDPIAAHTLNYIDIADWHRPSPFPGLLRIYSPESARPSTAETGTTYAQIWGTIGALISPGSFLLFKSAAQLLGLRRAPLVRLAPPAHGAERTDDKCAEGAGPASYLPERNAPFDRLTVNSLDNAVELHHVGAGGNLKM